MSHAITLTWAMIVLSLLGTTGFAQQAGRSPRAAPPQTNQRPGQPAREPPEVGPPAPADLSATEPSPLSGQRIATISQGRSIVTFLTTSLRFVQGMLGLVRSEAPATAPQTLAHLRLQGDNALRDLTLAESILDEFGTVATSGLATGDPRAVPPNLGAMIGRARATASLAHEQVQSFLANELAGSSPANRLAGRLSLIASTIRDALVAQQSLNASLGVTAAAQRTVRRPKQRAPATAAKEATAEKRRPARRPAATAETFDCECRCRK